MTETTRAVIADGAGGPEVLRVTEIPRPEPCPGQLLIEVHAAGINRPDVMQRQRLGSVVGGELAAVVRGDEDPERANALLQQREATIDSERT